MTIITVDQKFGLIGGVVRGVAPDKCAGTCMKYLTPECAICHERPIKDIDISFGDIPIEEAIREGLVTAEQVERFRNEITGGT